MFHKKTICNEGSVLEPEVKPFSVEYTRCLPVSEWNFCNTNSTS